MAKILVCSLLISLLMQVSAFADGAAASVSVGEETVEQGSEITISVSIRDNPGLAAWLFTVSWDKDTFEFIPDTLAAGPDFANGMLVENAERPGELVVNWYDTRNVSQDGEMFHFQLKVSEEAALDDYEFRLRSSIENTINIDEDEIPVAEEGITITVHEKTIPASEETQNEAGANSNAQADSAAKQKEGNSGSLPLIIGAVIVVAGAAGVVVVGKKRKNDE